MEFTTFHSLAPSDEPTSESVSNTVETSTWQDSLSNSLVNASQRAVNIISAILGTVGVLDNLFVIVVFVGFVKITEKKMNLLIVHQSVIDMLASLLTLLHAVIPVNGTNMRRESLLDQFVCRIWLTRTVLWSVLAVSTFNMVLMAVERYIAVVYPIWYKVYTQTSRPCAPFTQYASQAVATLQLLSGPILAVYLPLAIVTFSYTRIIYTLRTQVAPGTGAATASSLKAQRNATMTSLIVCCGFAACYAANVVVVTMSIAGVSVDFNAWYYHLTQRRACDVAIRPEAPRISSMF